MTSYLTLPSNTTDFASNSTSSFRVKLPYGLDFQGNWEVALTEITYPVSWNTIKLTEGKIEIIYKHNGQLLSLQTRVQPGFYNDIEELVKAIKYALEKESLKLPHRLFMVDFAMYRLTKLKQNNRDVFNEWEKLGYSYNDIFQRPNLIPEPTGEGTGEVLQKLGHNLARSDNKRHLKLEENLLARAVKIDYSEMIKRVELKIDTKTINMIKFDPVLQFTLGFQRDRILNTENNLADYNSDISAGITTFYIYCSIVESQCIGNSLEQILRTVPLTENNKLGNVVYKEFLSPHYINLLSKSFDTIQVDLRDDSGKLVDFQFGKVILKIHFRRKSLLNL